MDKIILIGVDEIIEINKILGGGVLNMSNLNYLVAQIEAKYKDKDFKRQIVKIGLLYYSASIIYSNFVAKQMQQSKLITRSYKKLIRFSIHGCH